MITIRPIVRVALCSGSQSAGLQFRGFATSKSARASNQIFDSVRRAQDLHNYQILSASARTPLLTLWTTSYCPTCKSVSPLLRSIIESGVGEAEGGVAFCEVQFDAPDIMSAGTDINGLAMTNLITAVPTLLAFDAEEPCLESRVMDGRKLTDRSFLEKWVRTEARRIGGGGGKGGGKGVLGGLFGSWR